MCAFFINENEKNNNHRFITNQRFSMCELFIKKERSRLQSALYEIYQTMSFTLEK